VRVVIAVDLALVGDGLTRLLRDNGIEVIAAVRDGDSLIREVVEHTPDLAVVDIRLPPEFRDEGLRAALELRKRVPETAILVVSQYVEETYAGELLAGGAEGVGYLLKDRIMHVADFLEAVRRWTPTSWHSCSAPAAKTRPWRGSPPASARSSG